jgi:hypothetical protein
MRDYATAAGRLKEREKSWVPPLVHIATLTNLLFSISVLLAWPEMSPVLADPIAVMTGGGVPRNPTIVDYPYFLLWLTPMVGVAGVYIARAFGFRPLARFMGTFPLLLTLLSVAWLYWVSDYWNVA